ncbi:MAG TPA: efflux RND transporter periplasmic adaptor subunit [Stellaceae bacterium]|nr:efflux RND transporter periplasmic adaptor subunit [Stellaceae bacterium]
MTMSMIRYRDLVGLTLAALLSATPLLLARAQEHAAHGAHDTANPPRAGYAEKDGETPPGYADISVAPDVQQRIGVALGTVQETPLTMTIRAVGIVRPDETKIAHIHLKTEGWVEKLFVSFTGQKVKVGDPMLSIYSPAFFTAQGEFLSALRSIKANPDSMGDRQVVLESSRRRLELWDVPKEAIEALERTGKLEKSLTLRSPISGTVLEKKAFEGQYVMPQGELYIVADLSTVWMQAKVFEYELPHIEIGMPVSVTVSSLRSRPLIGKVVFVDPVVDETTRSVQVRVELPNHDGELRPGMFGHIVITHSMGNGLTVPVSAVIRTGERDIAYRVVSADHFVPVQVKISPLQFEDRLQILEGLKAGDQVVTSANFLIDSESRLRAGAGSMADMPGMGVDTSGGKKAGQQGNMKEMSTKGGTAGHTHQ